MRTRRKRASSPKFDSKYYWNAYLTKWTDFRVNCIPEAELPLCQVKEDNVLGISVKGRDSDLAINTKETVLQTWSEGEKDLFTQRFVKVGKNFPLIANALPYKTVAQCIHYYYLTKHQICYKQLRKISNEEEHGTRSHCAQSKGIEKGNKNAEKDIAIVLEHKPRENTLYTTYDNFKRDEGFSAGKEERTEKPGTSTATITANYFQRMERVREKAYDDDLIIDGRSKSNGRSSSVIESDFSKPKVLCTATKLLSKTYRGNDAFNFYERSRNSKGKTFIRPGTGNQTLSINRSYQRSDRDLPSRSGYGDNMPPAISASGSIPNIKNEPSSSHLDVIYKKSVTDCASKTCGINQPDTLLTGDRANTSKRYDSLCKVLDLSKGADKIQGKCFDNFTSFKRKLEVVQNVANDQMKESFQKMTAERDSTHKTIKEESIQNKRLVSPRKGKGEGPNTAKHHLDTFYLDDEMMADYSAPKFENILKDEQSCKKGKVEVLKKLKRCGNYDHLKMAKKKRIPQTSETSHSSTSSPENKFRLVSTEDEYLTAGDPSDIGDNGGLSIDGYLNRRQPDREGKSRKRKECLIHAGQYFEKQTATVDQFFDGINGLLFNTPRLVKASKKPCDNHQRNYNSSFLEVTAPETQSAHRKLFQGALKGTIQHGKMPLNQRGPAKNESNYICPKKSPTAKSQSRCRKNQLDNEVINKNDEEGSKYEQASEISRNVKPTKRTFDLAGVFYEGILDNRKTTCGQGCPDNDFRKTSEKTKTGAKHAKNKKGKPLLKRLSAVGHSTAKNMRADGNINNGKTSCNRQAHNDEIEVLIKPTTSKSSDNAVDTKAATSSRNMDCHITCKKGSGLASVGQQGSFIDTVIETIIAAKPFCSGDQKLLFVTNEKAMNTTKGIKRKNTIARFDNKSFKRASPNDNNSKKASPQEKSELAKKSSFDWFTES